MSFSSDIAKILSPENVSVGESLRELTTFRAGGPADYYLTPGDLPEFLKTMECIRAHEMPVFLLGRGSNILCSDEGYRGVVVSLRKHMNHILEDGETLVAEAGAMLSDVANRAMELGLAGLEFASGIPGTVGGGLVMNAGAYGSEMKDVVVMATAVFPDGSIREFQKEEMELSYRHSVFSENCGILLSVEFALKPGNREEIRARMEELSGKRREKQPLQYASAGSTFKRPAGHYAGALIEEAGLKGFSVGDAEVSEKHAGFIINRGNASASEIYRLIRSVQAKVLEHSGVQLEREVLLLGTFPEEEQE